MAKKRANGEGSIRKRSDGRWEGRYTAGYHPDTGKRIIKNVLGSTQAEVKAKLAAKLEECKQLDMPVAVSPRNARCVSLTVRNRAQNCGTNRSVIDSTSDSAGATRPKR